VEGRMGHRPPSITTLLRQAEENLALLGARIDGGTAWPTNDNQALHTHRGDSNEVAAAAISYTGTPRPAGKDACFLGVTSSSSSSSTSASASAGLCQPPHDPSVIRGALKARDGSVDCWVKRAATAHAELDEAQEQMSVQAKTLLGLDKKVKGFDVRLRALEDLATQSKQEVGLHPTHRQTAAADDVSHKIEQRVIDIEKRVTGMAASLTARPGQFAEVQRRLCAVVDSGKRDRESSRQHMDDMRRGLHDRMDALERDMCQREARQLEHLSVEARRHAQNVVNESEAALLRGPVSELAGRLVEGAVAETKAAMASIRRELATALQKVEERRLAESKRLEQFIVDSSLQALQATETPGGLVTGVVDSAGSIQGPFRQAPGALLRQTADRVADLESRARGEEQAYWTSVQVLEQRMGSAEEDIKKLRDERLSEEALLTSRLDSCESLVTKIQNVTTLPKDTAPVIAQDPAAHRRPALGMPPRICGARTDTPVRRRPMSGAALASALRAAPVGTLTPRPPWHEAEVGVMSACLNDAGQEPAPGLLISPRKQCHAAATGAPPEEVQQMRPARSNGVVQPFLDSGHNATVLHDETTSPSLPSTCHSDHSSSSIQHEPGGQHAVTDTEQAAPLLKSEGTTFSVVPPEKLVTHGVEVGSLKEVCTPKHTELEPMRVHQAHLQCLPSSNREDSPHSDASSADLDNGAPVPQCLPASCPCLQTEESTPQVSTTNAAADVPEDASLHSVVSKAAHDQIECDHQSAHIDTASVGSCSSLPALEINAACDDLHCKKDDLPESSQDGIQQHPESSQSVLAATATSSGSSTPSQIPELASAASAATERGACDNAGEPELWDQILSKLGVDLGASSPTCATTSEAPRLDCIVQLPPEPHHPTPQCSVPLAESTAARVQVPSSRRESAWQLAGRSAHGRYSAMSPSVAASETDDTTANSFRSDDEIDLPW